MSRLKVPGLLVAAALALALGPLRGGRTPVPADFLSASAPWSDADRARMPALANRHQYDILIFTWPAEVLASRALAAGELPWWDSTRLSGHPLLADGQTGTLYPPRLLLQWLLPPEQAYPFHLALHLAAAGLGMYAYLRHRACSRAAAALGALVWMLGGQSAVFYKYGSAHVLAALLPAALLCLDRIDGPRPARAAAGLALAVAGLLLASHAQLLYYATIILAAAAASRAWTVAANPATRARAFPYCAWISVAVALGVSAAAPQVIPLLDLAAHSQRAPSATPFPAGARYAALTATFVFPRLFGGPLDRVDLYTWFPGANLHEFQGYLGVLPVLLLLPLGLRAAPRREAWFWGALAGVAVLCAAGTPAFALLAAVVPGLSRASPFKILYIYSFAATFLAARGADALLAAAANPGEGDAWKFLRRWRWAISLGWFAALIGSAGAEAACAAGRVPPGSPLRWINIGNPVILLPLAWWGAAVAFAFVAARRPGGGPPASDGIASRALAAGLVAVCALDAGQFFVAYNPAYDPAPLHHPPPELDCLAAHRDPLYRMAGYPRVPALDYALHGIAPLFGLATAEGYESLYSGAYKTLTEPAGPGYPTNTHVYLSRWDSRVFDLLSVRHVLAPADAQGIPSHWRALCRGRMTVYENPRALPRAYVVHQEVDANDDADALRALLAPSFRPEDACVVMDGKGRDLTLAKPAGPDSARIVRETGNRLEIEATAGGPGLLVVTDTWDPGWTAVVDGQAAPVWRVYVAQRAVPLSAGTHRVELRYAPRGITAAWILCALGVAGIAGLVSFRR